MLAGGLPGVILRYKISILLFFWVCGIWGAFAVVCLLFLPEVVCSFVRLGMGVNAGWSAFFLLRSLGIVCGLGDCVNFVGVY